MIMMPVNHIAFSDDSKHVDGRFNSLALVSLRYDHYEQIKATLIDILKGSSIEDEFKWEKLRNVKYRFAAQKMIDFIFTNQDKLRIDILIWDLEDRRHKGIVGRDDVENLVRMYYHLVSTTFSRRWPIENVQWEWYPDKQSDVDWNTLRDCIQNKKHRCIEDLFKMNPEFKRVRLREIKPSESKSCPLIQMADLFAGMGSYSWGHYQKFCQWIHSVSGQSLPFSNAETPHFSHSEKERFQVIDYFDRKSKESRLRIGFETTGGFKSYNPKAFINFWLYEPQHELDKAPVKKR